VVSRPNASGLIPKHAVISPIVSGLASEFRQTITKGTVKPIDMWRFKRLACCC